MVKRDNHSHSITPSFNENVFSRSNGHSNQINVRSFIILRPGKGLNSCIKNNRANFSAEKSTCTVKLFGVSICFEKIREKKKR